MSPLEQAVLRRKLEHLQELLGLLRQEVHTPLQASWLTDANTFRLAGQHGLIRADLAQRLLPTAGLRNRLVHNYEAIDPSRVHAAMASALQDLDQRAGELTPWVRT